MGTPHLRNAFLTICNLRDELDLNTEALIKELFLQAAGKNKTLNIAVNGDNDSFIYLDPSSSDVNRTHIEQLKMVRGKLFFVPFDPDGNDERKEVEIMELSIPARIELIQFMLDKFD